MPDSTTGTQPGLSSEKWIFESLNEGFVPKNSFRDSLLCATAIIVDIMQFFVRLLPTITSRFHRNSSGRLSERRNFSRDSLANVEESTCRNKKKLFQLSLRIMVEEEFN